MIRNMFFLELLLFLESKNSFIGSTFWSHRYLELFNFGNEKERKESRGKGRKLC